MGAILFPEVDKECAAAAFLAHGSRPVPGFGCSDCACASHLYRIPDNRLERTLEGLNALADGNR
jgi:Uri superfamily endonuclease